MTEKDQDLPLPSPLQAPSPQQRPFSLWTWLSVEYQLRPALPPNRPGNAPSGQWQPLPLCFSIYTATSHWLSWGQTLPHTAGRQFFSLSFRMPPLKSPFTMKEIKSGISISTGHPVLHRGFLHCKQRLASANGQFLRVPEGNLVEIVTPHFRCLLRHIATICINLALFFLAHE